MGDERLSEFLHFIRKRLSNTSVDTLSRIMIVVLAIADAFGGSDRGMRRRTEARCSNLRGSNSDGTVSIGDLMGGNIFGEPEPGTGICRHRAITFKAVCDQLELCP